MARGNRFGADASLPRGAAAGSPGADVGAAASGYLQACDGTVSTCGGGIAAQVVDADKFREELQTAEVRCDRSMPSTPCAGVPTCSRTHAHTRTHAQRSWWRGFLGLCR
jgi:hypothetical protein